MDVSIGIKCEPSSPLTLSHCSQPNFDEGFGRDLFSDYTGNDDLGSDRSFPDDSLDNGFDSGDLSPTSLDDSKLDFGSHVFNYGIDSIDVDSGYTGDSGESSGEVSPCSVENNHHQYSKVEYCSSTNYDNDVSEGQKKLCLVCGDIASGFHYGVSSCEACKAFFKRTIQGNIDYSCPANGDCEITKRRRKACQACRFQKCLFVGMLREGVRLDRVRGGRQKYKRSPDSYPYVQQIFPIVKKQCLDNAINNHSYSTKRYVSVVDNKILQQLVSIEGQLEKLYARADPSVRDDECKFLTVLSDLADRELVITISWAKQVPGFASLSLSDQMNLLQHSWLEINLLNLVYRSSPYHGILRIAEDYKLTSEQAEKYGCSRELDTLTRKMCKKFTSLNITREEYLLLKSIILFNIDVVTERSDAGKSIQEKLHESLTDYVKSRSNGGLKRVGQLYLLLPAMTHLKLLAKQYWFDVKKSGKIMMHKLFLEMLEADS
ncbi:steroid hormone receptor ERR2-like isoform X1 [Mya arenaria]|uniref:steroid hormone receptor ERR2-like isoform X1 n=1 Tax=Mya arenaria TaxID=6604 RepID=UPI0022DFC426|nr:steroid hormone receptor ERR2-like isoform X1 [Mya arenaria]XP_052766918.1 steroid hormone receptor ERR2-like isoform X1 [Mya arenaria]XP_052766919.1 steroid hormone receptor ERR2-like isoform X1 [Mya arenaria]